MFENEETLNADLIRVGLRSRDVGSPDFTWWDFHCFVKYLPHDSATSLMRDPDLAWDLNAQLQALTADVLLSLRWMLHGQGEHPEPVPRPGVEGVAKQSKGELESLTVEEVNDRLGIKT